MDQIARQKQIDIKKFQGDENLETRYSLPSDVKYCRKCVMSNQRPVSVVEHRAKTDDAKNTLAFDGPASVTHVILLFGKANKLA